MLNILTGFVTVFAVIALGAVLARIKLIDAAGSTTLSLLAFYVATPALLFGLMLRLDVRHAFSTPLLVTVLATFIVMVTYCLLGVFVLRRAGADMILGALLSGYVNAANIGLPIAAFVMGDMSWMPPVLLVQVGIIQPLATALLDVLEARRAQRRMAWWRYLLLPLHNPITIGVGLGLTANLFQTTIPPLVIAPVTMVGQMSVPIMLIAFGVSLYLNGWPGVGQHAVQTWITVMLKLIWQPLVAYLLAAIVFHLPSPSILAVTVIAGLPSAQNNFVIAQRYAVAVDVARDSIFLNTLLSIPTLLVITLLLR